MKHTLFLNHNIPKYNLRLKVGIRSSGQSKFVVAVVAIILQVREESIGGYRLSQLAVGETHIILEPQYTKI